MNLKQFTEVRDRLQEQFDGIQKSTEMKPVIRHTNSIELLAALQLINQLMEIERIDALSPPGSTGPKL